MALRAGYYGLKRNVLKAIENLSGSKIIKSIGNGLSLSDAGSLSALIDTDSMEFKNGKLSAKSVSIQLEELPEAGPSNEGFIRQYIGPTNETYTNGFFYKSGSTLEKKNPVMTSNTSPEGEVSASSTYDARPAYYAFDDSNSTFWTSAANTKIGEWIQYEFDEAVVVNKIVTINVANASYPSVMKGFKIQGSNNGTDFVDLAAVTDNPKQGSAEYTKVFENSVAYKYYRLLCTEVYSDDPANSVGFSNINMFGPTDSYVWSKINVQ